MVENKRFTYEVTDIGMYYYDNGVRIFPKDFWKIINELNDENVQLKNQILHLKKSNEQYVKLGDEYLRKLSKEDEELKSEIMDLRAKNTNFKLIVADIVEDLEKQADSKEPIVINKSYVDWIKDNVDYKLNGLSDENEELKKGLSDDLELIVQLQNENEQLKKELKE